VFTAHDLAGIREQLVRSVRRGLPWGNDAVGIGASAR
jgi:hypothetical protein